MSTIVQSIREDELVKRGTRNGSAGVKSDSYMIPNQTCATCGQSTRGAYHQECQRDLSGRLLVRDAE